MWILNGNRSLCSPRRYDPDTPKTSVARRGAGGAASSSPPTSYETTAVEECGGHTNKQSTWLEAGHPSGVSTQD